MTYVEVYALSREDLLSTVDTFPIAKRLVRRAKLTVGLRREMVARKKKAEKKAGEVNFIDHIIDASASTSSKSSGYHDRLTIGACAVERGGWPVSCPLALLHQLRWSVPRTILFFHCCCHEHKPCESNASTLLCSQVVPPRPPSLPSPGSNKGGGAGRSVNEERLMQRILVAMKAERAEAIEQAVKQAVAALKPEGGAPAAAAAPGSAGVDKLRAEAALVKIKADMAFMRADVGTLRTEVSGMRKRIEQGFSGNATGNPADNPYTDL